MIIGIFAVVPITHMNLLACVLSICNVTIVIFGMLMVEHFIVHLNAFVLSLNWFMWYSNERCTRVEITVVEAHSFLLLNTSDAGTISSVQLMDNSKDTLLGKKTNLSLFLHRLYNDVRRSIVCWMIFLGGNCSGTLERSEGKAGGGRYLAKGIHIQIGEPLLSPGCKFRKEPVGVEEHFLPPRIDCSATVLWISSGGGFPFPQRKGAFIAWVISG